MPSGGRAVRVTAMRDITARKRTEDTLRALSLVDDLTGLYNRRGFATLAEQQMKIANRAKREMLLFFVDLDGLKAVNDEHGHAAGDAVLRAAADVLRRTFRDADILGRMGGDEFTVLVVEASVEGQAALEARLKQSVKDHNASNGQVYKLAMSSGVVRYDPRNPATLHEMITEADRLMYKAKRRRRSD